MWPGARYRKRVKLWDWHLKRVEVEMDMRMARLTRMPWWFDSDDIDFFYTNVMLGLLFDSWKDERERNDEHVGWPIVMTIMIMLGAPFLFLVSYFLCFCWIPLYLLAVRYLQLYFCIKYSHQQNRKNTVMGCDKLQFNAMGTILYNRCRYHHNAIVRGLMIAGSVIKSNVKLAILYHQYK